MKIFFCGEQAVADGLECFWVDTCCINKSTSEELSTATNYMFRWYQRASKCYVYLSDVSVPVDVTTTETPQMEWVNAFRQSRWFMRGWTLQELLVPPCVEFFSQQRKCLGTRESLMQEIHGITKLPVRLLKRQTEITGFSVEERFSWVARRTTTLKEDKVYCLLGIFGALMTPLYGEGEEHARRKLREEIQKQPVPQTRYMDSNAVPSDPSQPTPARDVMGLENLLRSLSYPEMTYRYYDVNDVQDDTFKRLLDHSNYREWRAGTGSNSLLMIRGKPGSGKATALKRAYDFARDSTRTDEATIAFFFNSRGASMETKLEGFFRSTLHQLLRSQDSTNDNLLEEWKRKKSTRPGWIWTARELQSMFKRYIVRSTNKITMFVDALDECESTSAARDLMDLLTKIGQCHDSGHSQLKVCISSRHYPNVGVAEPLQIIVEQSNRVNIEQYVQTTLQRLSANLSKNLSKEITSRSEGMFLWALLVLERIREPTENGKPLTKLYTIIRGTPQRLGEGFQELIDGIPIDERAQSNLLISWVLFAKRPLSLPELTHARAFRTEYSTYQDFEGSNDFVRAEQMRRSLAKYT